MSIVPYSSLCSFDPANAVVIFSHVPKTGGVTIKNVFTTEPDFVRFHVVDYRDWLRLPGKIQHRTTGRIPVITGHIVSGIHEILGPALRCHYFTFLRDPREIATSYYRYARQRENFDGDFPAFVRERLPKNLMVSHFGDGDLDLAKERLAEYFFVGLQEDFCSSFSQLHNLLRLTSTAYPVQNKTYPAELDLDQVSDLLEEHNAQDRLFYEWARKIYHDRKVQQGAPAALIEFNETASSYPTRTIPNEAQRKALESLDTIPEDSDDRDWAIFATRTILDELRGNMDSREYGSWLARCLLLDSRQALNYYSWLARTNKSEARAFIDSELSMLSTIPVARKDAHLSRWLRLLQSKVDAVKDMNDGRN